MKVFITVFMKVRRHRVDHEPLPPTSSEADASVTRPFRRLRSPRHLPSNDGGT